jgi:hypothetical protein
MVEFLLEFYGMGCVVNAGDTLSGILARRLRQSPHGGDHVRGYAIFGV